jgi:hypothetical protein
MGDAEAARPKQEEKAMNIFTCTSFEGYWPVGAAAVVVAPASRPPVSCSLTR